MCKRCYPRCSRMVPDSDAILLAAGAVRALYKVHWAGGGAHIVVDDMNVDDEDIAWSIAQADADEDAFALEALEALMPLTRLQRVRAIHLGTGAVVEKVTP